MAQTKPKAAQFYGVSGNGTAGQVLISDGNGGMSWGANTEQFTVSWATPTGQSLTYTQPNPQSSTGTPGGSFPSTTFTATKSAKEISGTATIAGLPTGITATQSLSGSGIDNILTVTLGGVFPNADFLNTNLTISGLTVSAPATTSYLVIAGGGGGNIYNGGGAGAGGYRASYNSEASGGGGSAETAITLQIATDYAVTIGAGGAAGTSSANYYRGTNGNNSVFTTITSIGGGEAGARDSVSASAGANGGSGGGGGSISTGGNAAGSGTANQGYAGGVGQDGGYYRGGGGGGAGAVGVSSASGGTGGAGVVSTITGSSVTRAGGGGAGANSSPGGGGTGGGGAGTNSYTMNSGAANTGGGGGSGGMGGTIQGGLGGSGIVIMRYLASYTVTIPGGLTATTTVVGSDKVTTFTAGTGNIQIN